MARVSSSRWWVAAATTAAARWTPSTTIIIILTMITTTVQANHSHPLFRRSVPEFEAMLNAMKCALRIVGLQVSEHHNNMIMCCGLWKMKAYVKDTAERVCENPHESKRVFDNIMTDELIYGTFTRSILRDDSLDCRRYPEGSRACDRLWAFITLALVLVLLILIMLMVGCTLACICWHRYRRRYHCLLQCKLADLDPNQKDRFLQQTQPQSDRSRRWMDNLRQAVLPVANSRHRTPASGFNNNKVLFKSDDTITFGRAPPPPAGKVTPDSAVPPSSHSTSQNTSTASLNEAPVADKP